MSVSIDRRSVLKAIAASTAAGLVAGGGSRALAAEDNLKLGNPAAFSFDSLKDTARRMVGEPYAGPARPAPDVLKKIDYDAWGKIHFNTDHALMADERFPVTFFHLGMFFQKAIEMHVVEGGEAREIIYDQSYFDMPADSVAHQLPKGAGFAGFRIQEPRDGKLDWRKNDWVAFLGASYFRAIGELYQYGLSARGLALDTAVAGKPEEFPDFTKIYIQKPETDDAVTVYALLDGPSVVGAYKFVMARGKGVVMDIEQALFLRQAVSRFGLAPLTSMYWFSETEKQTAVDWRPEIHDSDGLAMWTGWGEHLWRPLNNPPHSMASAFSDENPKGFGLLQRDRMFDHYQDGVHYEKRPSLWVEPRGQWGKGAVQLIELPTDDEIHDNVVAMWVPEKQPAPGTEFNLAYKLHWLADEPYPTDLARVVATRLGNGGQPGQPRPKNVRKFVVEFLGGPLANLPFGATPEMTLQTARGHVTDYKLVEAVPDGVPGHWRAQFDLAGVEGKDPVELRLQLTVNGKIATETWLFQYHPF
ncbi:glucan biosynthesis protein D [Aliidongia dinghuensis]|uniref:Glucan biosynthesis protein D n=1 Tax=Aliidongia dinghuensis TaxID=1867774 RepID=A0A8J2YWA4_9PROT|nr:glucan biosynthesis protein D [Aliidongia dinghuensis]GGF30874.1 glucan biosynthesis protein D [Aliidongia dinghuensis]